MPVGLVRVSLSIPSGLAVTNNHVVTGAAILKVYIGGDDTEHNARVVGVSECSDLAVIQVDAEDFNYLEWYDGALKTGMEVYAAGYPLAEPEFNLTKGHHLENQLPTVKHPGRPSNRSSDMMPPLTPATPADHW